MGTACRRRTFPTIHVTQAEVLERERLLRRIDEGTLQSHDRIRLRVLMRQAINPPETPPYSAPPATA